MNEEKIKKIYSLRHSFSIIGLTGRTGAGVSKVAKLLSENFNEIENIQPLKTEDSLNNKMRRYNISYNYAKANWKTYTIIDYKDVILLHLIRKPLSEIKSYFDSTNNFKEYSDEVINILEEFDKLIQKINKIEFINSSLKKKSQLKKLSKLFFSDEYKHFSIKINAYLKTKSIINRIELFQSLANNIRKSGNCFNNVVEDETHIYTIAETINRIIKGYKLRNDECHIAIDSLRNSLEIMFFKERYSAFYMISTNSVNRRKFLMKKYDDNTETVKELLKIDTQEYEGKGVSQGKFYVQDVQNCIQQSDIHFNHNPPMEYRQKAYDNFNELDKWSEYYLVGQIIKYTSLILHPGLITPSAQERCMQIADVAKSNSGCISRQVGAVITDQHFSVKSIGWNDVPNNVTPCLLKNINDLKNGKDINAYSPYEKENKYKFNDDFKTYYEEIKSNSVNGLNCSFCFKDFQNYFDKKENQVHTRSLHAEENAMMQISKYGGQPLKNGILFTTASPCELCAKKARQLEIKQIYYIDPYPGISNWHILRDGQNTPELILFSGAVGRAYHKLYDPIMSYKDELAFLIGKRPKEDLKRLLKVKNE
jgi:dCMP deaminase